MDDFTCRVGWRRKEWGEKLAASRQETNNDGITPRKHFGKTEFCMKIIVLDFATSTNNFRGHRP